MPRRSSERAPARRLTHRETVSLSVFVSAMGLLVLVWLGGFGIRGSLWSVEPELVRRSGIYDIYGNNVTQLANTSLLLIAAAGGYGAALWALRRGFPHSFQAAIAGCIIAALAILPVAPLTSPDAIHFAADVRTLWLHHEYPGSGLPGLKATAPGDLSGKSALRLTPGEIAQEDPANIEKELDDPVAREVRVFVNAPSSYGPVAYAIGGAPLPVVRDNVRANVFGVKLVAAVFLVLTALFTGLIAREIGVNPAFAAAFVGLNPLMLWEHSADGHNDSIMMAFGMLAVLFILCGGRAAAGRISGPRDLPAGIASDAVWSARQLVWPGNWPFRLSLLASLLSVFSKFSLAALGPLVAAWWFPRWRIVFAVVAFLGGLALFMSLFLNIGPDVRAIGPAAGLSANTPWSVLSGKIGADQEGQDELFGLAYLVFGAIAALIVARHPLEKGQDLLSAMALTMFAFLFIAAPSLRHWYQIWYLPFIPLCGRRWLVVAGLTFSLGGFLTILALNYSAKIESNMGISNPADKSVMVLWITVAVAAGIVWWIDEDRSRRLAQEAARRPRRTAMRRGRGY